MLKKSDNVDISVRVCDEFFWMISFSFLIEPEKGQSVTPPTRPTANHAWLFKWAQHKDELELHQ